ncbi:uncharacterized protein V1510DRAFT_421780 [Dipodascopsis tothii]|uniref:uncharacterized protein n=1 Tax=Dipodascopsis tothii TaxID=44089 RepID=UPI0034CD9427
MVLHNSKWDKRATRNYRRKHNLAPGESVESVAKAKQTGSEPRVEPRTEPRTEPHAEPSSFEPHDDDSEAGSAGSDASDASGDDSDTPEDLPSNAWRYQLADGGDDGPGIETYTKLQARKLRNLRRKQDLNSIQLEPDSDSEPSDAEDESGPPPPPSRTTDGRKIKAPVLSYADADDDLKALDRRIERMKVHDAIRDRYRLASAVDRTSAVRVPKSLQVEPETAVPAPARLRSGQIVDGRLEDEFDEFVRELDTPAPAAAPTAASGRSAAAAPAASRASAASVDPDDAFLDELLR